MKGFYELMMGATVRAGAANLVLTSGLGGMRPNTVILGFFQVFPTILLPLLLILYERRTTKIRLSLLIPGTT